MQNLTQTQTQTLKIDSKCEQTFKSQPTPHGTRVRLLINSLACQVNAVFPGVVWLTYLVKEGIIGGSRFIAHKHEINITHVMSVS